MSRLKHVPRHIVGGIALTNGLLLHTPDAAVLAVQTPTGHIYLKAWDITEVPSSFPFLHWPLVRGLWLLWRTIMWNSQVRRMASGMATALVKEERRTNVTHSRSGVPASLFPSFGLFGALLLYALIILAMSWWSEMVDGQMALANSTGITFVATAVFLGLLVRKGGIWPYMGYHGALHQAIHAYEDGDRTASAVHQAWPWQVRCGASVVSYVAILLITIGFIWPQISLWWSVPLTLLLFTISYEIVQLADRFNHTWWGVVLSLPGVPLQFAVARHPYENQSEVAARALYELVHYSPLLKKPSRSDLAEHPLV